MGWWWEGPTIDQKLGCSLITLPCFLLSLLEESPGSSSPWDVPSTQVLLLQHSRPSWQFPNLANLNHLPQHTGTDHSWEGEVQAGGGACHLFPPTTRLLGCQCPFRAWACAGLSPAVPLEEGPVGPSV